MITQYIVARQTAGAANATINRELAVLGRMLRLGYFNEKVHRLTVFERLKEAEPRQGSSRVTSTTPWGNT